MNRFTPTYGVYISQLIRYARACSAYENFSKRGKLLTNKLISIRKSLKSRIHHLSGKMRTIYPSVFKIPGVVKELRRLQDNIVLVLADKASNNIVFVKITIMNAF